ncbi:hypothetical protein [Acidovorax delafieldii]|uniref:hypothetical protein n=1 Tax=Acidovorax delafieldii TaxID=47920 RepID=UPI003ECD43D8
MTNKQIIAAHKRYCVEVTGNGDVGATANLADFTLDEAAARDILKLAEMAREMKLSRLERFDYSASFSREQPGTPEAEALGEENDVRVDCTSLVVTGTDFYFRAYEKHSGNPMSCAHQSLNDLASYFGINQTDSGKAQEPLLQWHVLGAHANGNFFDISVQASEPLAAFGVAAKMLEEADEEGDAQFFAAIRYGSHFELPGDSVVELSTVLDPEQKEVFSVPDSI